MSKDLWTKYGTVIKVLSGAALTVATWLIISSYTVGHEYAIIKEGLNQNETDHNQIVSNMKEADVAMRIERMEQLNKLSTDINSLDSTMNDGFIKLNREVSSLGQKVDDIRDALIANNNRNAQDSMNAKYVKGKE